MLGRLGLIGAARGLDTRTKERHAVPKGVSFDTTSPLPPPAAVAIIDHARSSLRAPTSLCKSRQTRLSFSRWAFSSASTAARASNRLRCAAFLALRSSRATTCTPRPRRNAASFLLRGQARRCASLCRWVGAHCRGESSTWGGRIGTCARWHAHGREGPGPLGIRAEPST